MGEAVPAFYIKVIVELSQLIEDTHKDKEKVHTRCVWPKMLECVTLADGKAQFECENNSFGHLKR